MNKKWLIGILIVFMLAGLPACGAAPTLVPSQTSAPATTVPPATETPRPSLTPVPSFTQQPPSPTITSTPTLTPTLTSTMTPTPQSVFRGFQIESSEFTYYGMLFTFRIPGIQQNYRLMIGENEYKCNLNPKAPDHLYCNGVQLKKGQSVNLVFLPLEGSNTPVYETTYIIAPVMVATLDPVVLMTQGVDKCSVRGVHVTCETEYRNDGRGGYCIVATCVDWCGYYYSVHTCPEGSENWGIYPMTGTPPLPGNR